MRNGFRAVAVGGLLAGTIDLTQACVLFSWKVPYGVTAGLLGRHGFPHNAATYALGVFLHFFIAFVWAAIYYLASRRLDFLIDHPLVCGLVYGGIVEEVMNLVVLPLSALHARGPYRLEDLLLGLGVHMVTVGLPIAYSVRWFSSPSSAAVLEPRQA